MDNKNNQINSITRTNGLWYGLLMVALLIALVVFKWEALSLPYFWDESWVYMPAIRTLAAQGPSVMPGCIDANLYTGHPLLFYFLAATWIKIFGTSTFAAHSFPLLLSIFMLLSVYFIAGRWTGSWWAGIVAAMLVAVQPIFLTQSTYLLIEVWLSLLFLWCFWFYFERNLIGFSILMIAALWSKESAYVLLPCFFFIMLADYVRLKQRPFELLKNLGILALIAIAGFSFFILQHQKLGWYFFPRHANWVTLDEFWYKFNLAFDIIFQQQGRLPYYLSAIVVFAAGFIWTRKPIEHHAWMKLAGILLFVFGFILFASINFFSTRYLFGSIPLLMVVLAALFNRYSNPWLRRSLPVLILLYGGFRINASINNPEFGDVELSYTRLLKAEVAMTTYVKEHPPVKMYAPFLMLSNLSNPYCGMVQEGMSNLSSNPLDEGVTHWMKHSNEGDPVLDSLVQAVPLKLVYQTKEHQASVELYSR